MKKVRWGILSTAKIGLKQVIPAMQKSRLIEVAAIASRDASKAKQAADGLKIAKAYDSYEALLADPDIDAVYNPLPNQLHVPYAIKALQSGKHVLCEKPIGMDASDAQKLIEAAQQYPKLKVMEAFMYRFHPQWQKAKAIVEQGLLGEVKTIHAFFSYFNADANNIRNKPETGGGALMDIGCYCISFPRFIYGSEPEKVVATAYFDAVLKTDTLTSGILDFGGGKSATFTCSTQLEPYQRVHIFGTKGKLEIEIPVNAIPGKKARLWLQTNREIKEIKIEKVNQYTLQGEAFSKAILHDTPVPAPLTDALDNMRVIDAIFKSAKEGKWIRISP
ncbi:NAD-binding protein [Mucilaginibacter sp. PPCGB 2223]|uniref:Gfo/Idh/MocA family protein n=1 Tax=Mucilaginibacter sp. PPCGB 2223 TaxID=1886027 RepID=UPI0008260470|nr:Gfo/Idh/MocA family oxidoreductase [Mucilaginibacter sp. PPCGB 2223]OCX53086.1 NAD-binding protein [Mucilaginibacter sp. PPCGB 2223]